MEQQISPASPELEDEPRRALLLRLNDYFFGYDFFISYAWMDGRTYAVELYKQLKRAGFECFLDSSDFAKGDRWKGAGRRALRKTSRLILIGTARATESSAVLLEIQIFSKLNRRIIPINIGGALGNAKPESTLDVVRLLAPDALYIADTVERLQIGPSPNVVDELRTTFQITRQQSKRIRWLSYAASVLAVMSIVATAAAIYGFFEAIIANQAEIAAQQSEEQERKAKEKAVEEKNRAERQARITTIHNLAILSEGPEKEVAFRLLLGTEAATRLPGPGEPTLPVAELALRRLVGRFGAQCAVDMKIGDSKGEPVYVQGISLSGDGRWLVAGVKKGRGGLVYVWDLVANDPLAVPRIFDTERTINLENVGIGDNGQVLIAASRTQGGEDKPDLIWNLKGVEKRPNSLSVRNKSYNSCYCAAVSSNSRWAVLGQELWDLRPPTPIIRSVTTPPFLSYRAAIFESQGRWLVTRNDDIIRLWDLSSSDSPLAPTATQTIKGQPGRVSSVANRDIWSKFSPGGRWMAAWGDQICVWDLSNATPGKLVVKWTDRMSKNFQKSSFNTAAFSHDDRWLAAGSTDSSIRIWNLMTVPPTLSSTPLLLPKNGDTPRNIDDDINDIAFSPNGRWLAAGNNGGVVRLWSMGVNGPEPSPRHVLTFGAIAVHKLAFSNDGRWLAAIGYTFDKGQSLGALWELAEADSGLSVTIIGTNEIRGDFVDVAFSPNSRWLLAFLNSSVGCLPYLCPLNRNDLLISSRRLAGRNMTASEWKACFPDNEPYRATFPDLPAPYAR